MISNVNMAKEGSIIRNCRWCKSQDIGKKCGTYTNGIQPILVAILIIEKKEDKRSKEFNRLVKCTSPKNIKMRNDNA